MALVSKTSGSNPLEVQVLYPPPSPAMAGGLIRIICFMGDLERKPNGPVGGEDNVEELRELRELYSDVVGKEKTNLWEDWEEAGVLRATLDGFVLEGILAQNMTVREVLDVLRRRQHELLQEIKDIVHAKEKIDPEGEL